jgi:proteic killer suppression protein
MRTRGLKFDMVGFTGFYCASRVWSRRVDLEMHSDRSWMGGNQLTCNSIDELVAARVLMLYTTQMIKSFRHKGLQLFFETSSKAAIQAAHAARLHTLLTALNAAISADDMNAPAWRLHKLSGKNPKGQSVQDHWSVSVNGNWRLTFCFEGEHAILVDYQDYH